MEINPASSEKGGRLVGRVAIVTGAGSGIGRATACHLASLGARIVLNGRTEGPLRDVQGVIGSSNATCVVGNAATMSTIGSLFAAATGAFGAPADLVVVNAGRGLAGSATTSSEEDWEALIEINITGSARLIRAAGLHFLSFPISTTIPKDIVIMGSIVGKHVSAFSTIYSSTKAAVASLAEGTRRELGPKGVRVTIVEPGFVKTDFQNVAGYEEKWFSELVAEVGPVLDPDDVARLIGFIVQQPPHVHLNEVVIRPVRQIYP